MIRLETHCHTKYSKDSMLPLSMLYLKCRVYHIDWIAITEHNNIQGAIEFKKYCIKKKASIHVIIGEEIMTSQGEIIGLFLHETVPAGLSCNETIDLIKKQNGIVYVPHPYDEKRSKTVLEEEYIKNNAHRIDCIECYNGRNISESYGFKQNDIADKYGLTKVIGSDAHTICEIGRNYMLVDCVPDNPEHFMNAIENATFHKKKCLKLSHKITKLVKLIRMIKKGNFNEIYRIINRRIGKPM
ncbi:PHP domain-containing protein [uncultured Holdemanella sp.]|uniref:PHP domain-containing protein n=1 Tax=uncultured Holdemanella sp. TaxID=1763549 RepID=UPI0025873BBB|nr:PHP domain-containing protein [uncultured Holdemanella sp.]